MRLLVDVTLPKGLTLTSDKTSICAGGWDDGRKSYSYLEKESGQVVAREKKPNQSEPHIATLTATLGDDEGRPIAGKTVTFSWDMPGPAPVETRTATTDAKGEAKVDVISGDELSKDSDEETGQSLFDNPVEVKAKYLEMEKAKSLDVVAPEIEWQYKNESGSYEKWNGETWALYSEERSDIPLRVILKSGNLPVKGHMISWGFDKIFDKNGEEMPTSDPDYMTYGRMSGLASTTTSEGYATATYSLGSNFGQIVFRIDDESVETLDVAPSSDGSNSSPTVSASGVSASSTTSPTSNTVKKKKKRKTKKAPRKGVYKWALNVRPAKLADGTPSPATQWSYPAPSGEEDNELLDETLSRLQSVMNKPGLSPNGEAGWDNTGNPRPSRLQQMVDNAQASNDPYGQRGDWWISQAIGDDPDSETTHFADMRYWDSQKKKTRYASAAFDLVLTKVPIFKDYSGNKPLAQFEPYVRALRAQGFVAWHRWAGEYNSETGGSAAKPSSIENEIHGIDPATPAIKPYLRRQITGFRNFWANADDPSGYRIDFPITEGEKVAVENRMSWQDEMARKYPGFTSGPFPPPL